MFLKKKEGRSPVISPSPPSSTIRFTDFRLTISSGTHLNYYFSKPLLSHREVKGIINQFEKYEVWRKGRKREWGLGKEVEGGG